MSDQTYEPAESAPDDILVIRRPWRERALGLLPAGLGVLAVGLALLAGAPGVPEASAQQIVLGMLAGLLFTLSAEIAKPVTIMLDARTRRFLHRAGWKAATIGDLGGGSRVEIESVYYEGIFERWNVWLRVGTGPDDRYRLLSTRDEAEANAMADTVAARLGLETALINLELPIIDPPHSRRRRKVQTAHRVRPLRVFVSAPDMVQRQDEEEIRFTVSMDSRKHAGIALALSVATLAFGSSISNFLTYGVPIDTPYDFRPWLWLAYGAACGGIAAGLAYLPQRWFAFRRKDRTFRGADGWLSHFSGANGDLDSIVVERSKKLFGPVTWLISVTRGGESLPVLTTPSGREARGWVDRLSEQLGLPVKVVNGTLPASTVADCDVKRSADGQRMETPEQRAAREVLETLHRKHAPRVAAWRLFTAGGAIACVAFCLATGWVASSSPGSFPATGGSLIFLCALAMFASMGGWYWSQNTMAQEIGGIDSVSAVGPLLDLAGESSAGKSAGIRIALTRLLKRMRPSDGASLNPVQRETLRGMLTTSAAMGYADLQTSILRALEQIGEEKDIPALDELLSRTDDESIRSDIQDCMAAIYNRSDSVQAGRNLLRPVEGSQDESALLRPAWATGDQDPATLLRSSQERTYEATEEQVEQEAVVSQAPGP